MVKIGGNYKYIVLRQIVLKPLPSLMICDFLSQEGGKVTFWCTVVLESDFNFQMTGIESESQLSRSQAGQQSQISSFWPESDQSSIHLHIILLQ